MWRSATLTALAVLALSACNGGGTDDPTASGSPSTTPPPTTTLPTTPPTSAATTPTATSTCPSLPPLPPGLTVVSATVSGGRVTTEHRVWSVRSGSRVRVVVTSDVADEVHVHTYDEKAATVPGCPIALDFSATIPGTHEVELEKAHKQLFDIKVS